MKRKTAGCPRLAGRAESNDVLVANVGNTRTRLARFGAAGRLLRCAVLSTDALTSKVPDARKLARSLRDESGARVAMRDLLGGSRPPTEAVIGSVVPRATANLRRALAKMGLRVRVYNSKIPPGLTVRARGAGSDRVANALAAHRRTGRGAYVVDAGTALTISVVDRRGVFLGGAIAPGIDMELRSLASGTALLPQIEAECRARALGADTVEAILAGCVAGTAARVEGLLARMRRETGVRAPVFLTGGGAAVLSPLLRERHAVVPQLTLEGLYWAWRLANLRK